MYISKKQDIIIHWWGNKILLINGMKTYSILENEEEIFFLKHLTVSSNIDTLTEQISKEFGSDDLEVIENFIHIFIENYMAYFSLTKYPYQEISISGGEGLFYPVDIHISLGNICLQNCKHCYKDAKQDGRFINIKYLCKFLDEMIGRVPFLTLSGGEPTLYPHFAKLLLNYGRHFKITVLTSGYKISDELLDLISLYNCNMTISLYSSDPIEHDAFVNVDGSFREIMNTIEKAQNRNIPLTITTILTSTNYSDIVSLVNFIAQKAIRNINIGRLIKIGRAKISDIKPDSSFPSVNDWNDSVKKIRENYPSVSIQSDSHEICDANLSPFKCSAGSLSWSIFEDGSIQPCGVMSLPELSMGNISDINFPILSERGQYNARISNVPCISLLNSGTYNCPFEIK